MPAPRPAVFMDRDGTLSHEVGYVNHLSRFRLYPWTVDAIRLVNRAGWLAVVVTNQAGVARGYFPESLIHEVHASLRASVEAGGARLDGIFFCPHHPSVGEPPYRLDCDCRKPKPGLISRAAREFDIDLAGSWMVGDRYGDVELARNASVNSAFVLSGYGRGEWEHQAAGWVEKPDLVAEDLLEAVKAIVNRKAETIADQMSALPGGSA